MRCSVVFCATVACTAALLLHVCSALPIKSRGTMQDVQTKYNAWKTRFVVNVGTDQARVQRPENGGDTVSEGMGYGMLLAVHFNDHTLFTKMWQYVRAGNHLNQNGLMNWQINSGGAVIGQNSATDAELDMAYALLVAVRVKGWCEFTDAANNQINKILSYEVDGANVLKPGDMWGGSSLTNPSYFSPAYYQMFLQHTGVQRWSSVIDTTYATLNKISQLNAGTGLVPDWCTKDGVPTSGMGYQYRYDAARAPWRISLDAWWFDRAQAKTFCDHIAPFFGNAPYNVGDAYSITGAKLSNNNNAAFVGPAACCVVLSGTDAQADAYWNWLVSAGPSAYYQDSLAVITMLMVSGQMINPMSDNQCVGGVPSTTPTPSGAPVTHSPTRAPSGTRSASHTPSKAPLVFNLILRSWNHSLSLTTIAEDMISHLCELANVVRSSLTVTTSIDTTGWAHIVVRAPSTQQASALLAAYQTTQDNGEAPSDSGAQLGYVDHHSKMHKETHALSIAAVAGIGVGIVLLVAILVVAVVVLVVVITKRVYIVRPVVGAAASSDSQVELNASNVLYSTSSL
jgi:endo-1,4-beta-D-glucanase Y